MCLLGLDRQSPELEKRHGRESELWAEGWDCGTLSCPSDSRKLSDGSI